MITKEMLAAIADDTMETVDPEMLLENIDLLEKANTHVHELLINTRMKKIMQDFGELDTDIYIVTFPKSGTTLMQMLLYQMTTDGNMDFAHLYDVSPWCRHSAFLNSSMPSVGQRRIIKTHDEYEVFKDMKKAKFILVIRDFADAISSFHEHIKNYDNPSAEFTGLCNKKMKDWFTYNTKWLDNKNGLDLLSVHYEDLITDKAAVINEIAQFAGIEIDETSMQRVLERTSFSFMKQHETKFGEQPEQGKVYNNFIRRGKVGEGETKFSVEQSEQYQSLLQDHKNYSQLHKYIK